MLGNDLCITQTSPIRQHATIIIDAKPLKQAYIPVKQISLLNIFFRSAVYEETNFA